MKIDGTITMGNLITAGAAMLSVGIGWGVVNGRLDAQADRQLAQGAQFSQAILRIDEALKEQRQDQKDLAKVVNLITTDTALIRGRLSGNDGNSQRLPK